MHQSASLSLAFAGCLVLGGCHPFEDVEDYPFAADALFDTSATADGVVDNDTVKDTVAPDAADVLDGVDTAPDVLCGDAPCGPNASCLLDKQACECEPGFGDCTDGPGCETVLAEDPLHCGTCGQACKLTEQCLDGVCVCGPDGLAVVCAEAKTCCEANDGARCSALANDVRNCGVCGQECGARELCTAGVCTCGDGSGCGAGQTCCGGACIDGDGCACGTIGECVIGESCCDGTCVMLRSDADHCGACGVACPVGQVCVSGACRCSLGMRCGDLCVRAQVDPENCGACGNVCPESEWCCGGNCLPSNDVACAAASCLAGCDRNGLTCCNLACHDLRSSLDHCGGCGGSCDPYTNGIAECASGLCGFKDCEAGWENCDVDLTNGCETDTSSSSQHCGACDRGCDTTTRACDGGLCVEGEVCAVLQDPGPDGLATGAYLAVCSGCDPGSLAGCYVDKVCDLVSGSCQGCITGVPNGGYLVFGFVDVDGNAASASPAPSSGDHYTTSCMAVVLPDAGALYTLTLDGTMP